MLKPASETWPELARQIIADVSMEMGNMAELEDLKRKLAARKGKPNYAENVREIEARIAEIEAEKTSESNGNLS